MKSLLPIKNLIRLNWLLVLSFTAIISLYLIFLLDAPATGKLLLSFMTALGVGIVGFTNVGILIALEKKIGVKSPKFNGYRFVFTYLAGAIIYVSLSPIFNNVSPHKNLQGPWENVFIFIVSSLIVNSAIILMQNFIILQSDKAHSDLENSRLKIAHAEAANLFLKQQIHPHFLFNALNTLKALYRKDQNAADNYIVHLANFLRASITDQATKLATVEDELALLNDYFEMQKIRFGKALECSINLPDETKSRYYLPSFSLQLLLENAIKHNELTLEAPLYINVSCKDGYLIMTNNLQQKKKKLSSTNQGLANLAERYKLLSGDEILIKDGFNVFSVSIKLLCNEYSDYRR